LSVDEEDESTIVKVENKSYLVLWKCNSKEAKGRELKELTDDNAIESSKHNRKERWIMGF
jgi:hypothetical protein